MMWRILALIASNVKKTAVNPEVRSQIDKAVKMAAQYYKGFRVIQNQHGEIVVFPTVVPIKAEHMTDLRNIKNIGRDYKDPCQLIG
ncbi:MAG: hypothetical protein H6Q69_1180 [Firmicutes bacterium]|nr:hypothetical protein [Bacillota bacterium]